MRTSSDCICLNGSRQTILKCRQHHSAEAFLLRRGIINLAIFFFNGDLSIRRDGKQPLWYKKQNLLPINIFEYESLLQSYFPLSYLAIEHLCLKACVCGVSAYFCCRLGGISAIHKQNGRLCFQAECTQFVNWNFLINPNQVH